MGERSPLARRLRGRGSAALPGIAATLLLLALHVFDAAPVRQLGNLLFDAWQRAAPRAYEPAPVRVVDIDDETIRRLGQWPWPRTDVARLTTALAGAGASAIAFDIVFAEPDRTSPARMVGILKANPRARGDYAEVARLADHDAILAAAFAAAPAVPGFFLSNQRNAVRPVEKGGFAVLGEPPLAAVTAFTGAIAPLPELGAAARGAGFVSIVGDRDAIVRRAPLLARIGDRLLPSLSVEALRVAQGAGAITVKGSDASGEYGGGEPGVVAVKVGAFEVPTTRAGELWMHYTAPREDRIVPAWRILENRLPPAELERLFAGHIVFVGTGAAGLRDLVATPVRERELGVIVHAQAAEQMILGRFLVRPDWAAGLERALVLALGLGLAFALPGLGAARGALVAGLALVAVGGGAWWAFREVHLLVDPVIPLLGVGASYMSVTMVAFYREERARAYIRRAFDRYLSPELVERIARDPGQLELGGEERDMTVMFCDVRSFSALSEKLAPKQIIGFLIEFLTPMTEILLGRKATIDKYIGDAILAFWNAPLDDPEHPRHAALAALAMIDRLAELNARSPPPPGSLWPGEVKIGIGLNSGPCCVGNMGSAQRLSYSLIGDTVNLTSRIEGLTKFYGVQIAVGAELAGRLGDFALLPLDLVRVVGRDAPEALAVLLGPPEAAATADFAALAAGHGAMLEAYRARDWDGADIARVSVSGPAERFGVARLHALYAARVERFRDAPPPDGWDGVFQATEK